MHQEYCPKFKTPEPQVTLDMHYEYRPQFKTPEL
jgi:hypothetical protein